MTVQQRIYANNAKTTIASPVGPSDTSIIVADTSKMPTIGTNQYFMMTIDSGTSIEVIEVHNISGNVLTNCVRGCEGTTAQSFLIGVRI